MDSSEQSGSFLLLDSPLNSHSGPQGHLTETCRGAAVPR